MRGLVQKFRAILPESRNAEVVQLLEKGGLRKPRQFGSSAAGKPAAFEPLHGCREENLIAQALVAHAQCDPRRLRNLNLDFGHGLNLT